VTHVVCEIALSKGRWSYYPSPSRVRRKLGRVFGDWLLAMTFHDPGGDTAVEVEISVDGDEDSCDWLCDTIFRTFLEWKPEYESMIEVSLAVD
jgi:hypothetical protein